MLKGYRWPSKISIKDNTLSRQPDREQKKNIYIYMYEKFYLKGALAKKKKKKK